MLERKGKSVFQIISTLFYVLLALIFSVQSQVWAETATATDEQQAQEAIVLGKVAPNTNLPNVMGSSPVNGQKQNQPTTTSQQSSQSPSSNQAKVANDIAEGDTERNIPTLNQPVVDQANVLSAAEKQNLEQQIRDIYRQGKAQIGIIIVPTTGQEGIFDFAMRVAEQWKLGSAKQDNGLLIAVAVNDHKIHIATGYGLEGVLPDIMVSRIIRNQISPAFKQGQYAQGLQAAVGETERILNLDPEIARQAADELKERQNQAIQAQEAKDRTLTTAMIILVAGIFASFIIGNRLSAAVAGVTATAAGLIYGSGIVMSLILGFGVFFLLITSLAQLILQMFLSGGGRGGSGGGGGFGGGGGYSGGGGGFGGGGASGSW
ncbi:TPM domain-containing protein [Acinetobacter bereziniae]|uniref:TPM domain-containing protein n=2 Tax=Acinetobacter bereziniae TaxID=106648 RepID=UPI0018FFE101|nr:TPM domain-containing protein [Acinetobacter bereziniae]MBJ9901256.1 TPM domain-containing protein [Acinetobacter bereziniae]MCU4319248.1 TPM domain-containing protein [Acinetobacter bereziniae]MCU4597346.1 TPM domain-containing protein [Acinetobacter bereziniae]